MKNHSLFVTSERELSRGLCCRLLTHQLFERMLPWRQISVAQSDINSCNSFKVQVKYVNQSVALNFKTIERVFWDRCQSLKGIDNDANVPLYAKR